jgi:hypothetical protein
LQLYRISPLLRVEDLYLRVPHPRSVEEQDCARQTTPQDLEPLIENLTFQICSEPLQPCLGNPVVGIRRTFGRAPGYPGLFQLSVVLKGNPAMNSLWMWFSKDFTARSVWGEPFVPWTWRWCEKPGLDTTMPNKDERHEGQFSSWADTLIPNEKGLFSIISGLPTSSQSG